MEQRAPIVHIEYHADDFGLFPEQSRRILNCYRNGKLNGVSVMPNSGYLEECMALLRPYQKDITITVHLNLLEGRSICRPEEVPLLTDEDGILRNSFGKLLIHSFLPDRKRYRQQLKKELSGQISMLLPYLPEGAALRLDGHAHYHMIPVVFDALMDVIREEKRNVSYIRIPREFPSVYLRNWNKLKDFAAINLVKTLLLNVLAWYNLRKYPEDLQGISQRVFLGVFLSGRMHRENVAAILPDAIRLAQQKRCDLEILAHPGGVYEKEDIAQLTNGGDIAFLTSSFRQKEALMFSAEELV